MTERTLILIKPDAFARGLSGEIIARFERKGLRLVAMSLMTMSRELAERHYAEHAGKPFYEELDRRLADPPPAAASNPKLEDPLSWSARSSWSSPTPSPAT